MFENHSSNTYFKSINNKSVSSDVNTASLSEKEKVDIYNYRFEDEKKQLLYPKDLKESRKLFHNKEI